jgi:hypothetical protein
MELFAEKVDIHHLLIKGFAITYYDEDHNTDCSKIMW